ncbi:MAG TPA: alpha/beta fold hydrolase [Candidatus Kryptonia bacterium]
MKSGIRKIVASYSVVLSLVMLVISSSSFAGAKIDTSLVGDWTGTIEFSGAKLKIVFHVVKTDSGTLSATMDSPDQSAYGIRASSVQVKEDSAFIGVSSIGGAYEGRFSATKDTIDGKWKQGGVTIKLVVLKSAAPLPVVTMKRPQEPKPPFPYKSEDVSFKSEITGMTYTGTITEPDSGGQFPAAILITGSGAHDRDETIFGHKPFMVIADFLTRRGIAVLRVDDRGIGGSTGNKMTVTTTAHTADAIAEIGYLKGRNEIDSKKIGVIGHSEGGVIAPMVASESKDVAFVVLLAGTGMPGSDIILAQTKLIEETEGVDSAFLARQLEDTRRTFEIAKSDKDSAGAAADLRSYFESTIGEWGAEIKKNGGKPEESIDDKIRSLLNPWFRYFLTYDPRPALEKVTCPLLAMGGTLDLQVPAEDNLREIESALKKGGNKDYTIKLLPGLNHLFQDAKTGSPKEYSQIEETFSPQALKIMGDWIVERSRNR